VAHRGPVAAGDVGQERQVAARDEGGRGGVDLALEPVGPHPIDAELGRGPGPQGPEDRAGPHRQQLARQLHLDRLAEALERLQVADGVVVDAQAAHHAAQGPGPQPHQSEMPCSSALASRDMSDGTISDAALPSYSTATTCSAIGISTPQRAARSTTARDVFTPSATIFIS